MNLTQNQIEALKGKCPECSGGIIYDPEINGEEPCVFCQETGQATIEIEKEWTRCPNCKGDYVLSYTLDEEGRKTDPIFCDCNKGKIQKYKVGEEIMETIEVTEVSCHEETDITISRRTIRLKILSETEDEWRVCLK